MDPRIEISFDHFFFQNTFEQKCCLAYAQIFNDHLENKWSLYFISNLFLGWGDVSQVPCF